MAKFLERVSLFFWWNVLTISWFIAIFWKDIYDRNIDWLIIFTEKLKSQNKDWQKTFKKDIKDKMEKFK